MTMKHTSLRISAPFTLTGVDGQLPAGEYAVDFEEEPIEGVSWTAHRRVATYLHLPALGTTSGRSQMIEVDRAEFEALAEANTDSAADQSAASKI